MKKEARVFVKHGEIAYCKLEEGTCFECSKAYADGRDVECEIRKEFEEKDNGKKSKG